MRIILTNLNGVKQEKNGRIRHFVKAGSRWPMTVGYSKSVDYYPFPFYLAYSTAMLKEAHPTVTVRGIDGVARDYTAEELKQDLRSTPPDILIAEVTMITLKDDLKLIEEIQREFNCRVILTGVYVTSFLENALKDNPCADYAIYGEYESSLKSLIDCLLAKNLEGIRQIPGIILREGEVVFKSAQRASVSNFAEFPFPDRDDFPAKMYSDFAMHSPCVHMTATRGCPAGCVFCVERHVIYNSPKYRVREPKSVVDELETCVQKYGARQFYFDDQSLVVNKKFLMAFCDEKINRGLNVPWTCMGDAMFVDYQMLKKMRESGCIGMKFGIESANKEMLKRMGKPLDPQKALEVVRWCRELGIMTHATFCIGLPGENESTIKETIEYMEKLNLDSAQVSKAVPYPGTPLYAWAKENGYLLTEDLDKFDGASPCVLNYPDLSSEKMDYWYQQFLKKVSRKKLFTYLKHPVNSLEIIFQLSRDKGPVKAVESISTFIARAC
jgi:radical SAM superfamily enzyme YgiQ (UPF0313 family)